MTSDALRIAVETPLQDEVRDLITALDEYLAGLYPAESNHLLDLAALSVPEVTFLVGRHGSRIVGIAAMKREDGYGEVKRMFVPPEARGQGIARRLLDRIEQEARAAGLTLLRLEAGIHQPEALALYRSAGFRDRRPFGAYQPDPFSVFMEKAL